MGAVSRARPATPISSFFIVFIVLTPRPPGRAPRWGGPGGWRRVTLPFALSGDCAGAHEPGRSRSLSEVQCCLRGTLRLLTDPASARLLVGEIRSPPMQIAPEIATVVGDLDFDPDA